MEVLHYAEPPFLWISNIAKNDFSLYNYPKYNPARYSILIVRTEEKGGKTYRGPRCGSVETCRKTCGNRT